MKNTPLPDLALEQTFWNEGKHLVAGLDEAGRGSWAGPVSAGAVIFPPDPQLLIELPGVRDSKLMTPSQREQWAIKIKALAVTWSVGFASNLEIDSLGIIAATRLAMQRAIEQLTIPPEHLLIDALRLPGLKITQTALIKGDQKVLSIAAASILAKTTRDSKMVEFNQQYPGYGFDRHKGYGTKVHMAALTKLGPSPEHRLSFAPVARVAKQLQSEDIRCSFQTSASL